MAEGQKSRKMEGKKKHSLRKTTNSDRHRDLPSRHSRNETTLVLQLYRGVHSDGNGVAEANKDHPWAPVKVNQIQTHTNSSRNGSYSGNQLKSLFFMVTQNRKKQSFLQTGSVNLWSSE